MKQRIAAIVARTRTKAAGVTVYHELDPTLYSLTSNTFVGRVYAMFGLRNIADAAKGGTDYPQLSPEYVISANPGLIVLADTVCCGQNARTIAGGPAGRGSPPSGRDRSCASTTRSRRGGGLAS